MRTMKQFFGLKGFSLLTVFAHRGFATSFRCFAESKELMLLTEGCEQFAFQSRLGLHKFFFSVFATREGFLRPIFVGFCVCEFGGSLEEIVDTKFLACADFSFGEVLGQEIFDNLRPLARFPFGIFGDDAKFEGGLDQSKCEFSATEFGE